MECCVSISRLCPLAISELFLSLPIIVSVVHQFSYFSPNVVLIAIKSLPKLFDQMLEAIFVQK